MVHIIGAEVEKNVYCPLCDEKFKRRRVQYQGHITTAFFCRHCNIGTYEFDPAFNKWRDTDKEIPCANCGTPLKWFIRYMDGFFAAVCPRKGCGFSMRKDSNVDFNEKGEIELEDFDQPEPEVTEIKIPINKLNLNEDQKNMIRKKSKENESKKNKET